jgi:hypothetical protein
VTALAPFPCPECGGTLAVDTEAETESPVWRAKEARVEMVHRKLPVAFCSACEFVAPIKPLTFGEVWG